MTTGENLVDHGIRILGTTGVGPLAFGCWRFTTSSLHDATTLIETALDQRMNFIDTADIYGRNWGGSGLGACEALLGRVLTSSPGLRARMVLATKGGIRSGVPYDSSASWLTEACEASLRRMSVDHVDLYQIHRPDPLTHPAVVATTLMSLRDRGLIGMIGVSNHTPAQVAALQAHLDQPIASVQLELSALRIDPIADGTLDQAMELGTAVLAWSPLAGGRLASGEAPETLVAALDRIAEREGVDRTTVALAFVLALPSRPVAVVGTQRPDRLVAAVAAGRVQLDRSDVYTLIQASTGVPLP